MSFSFPNSPIAGDSFAPSGGPIYTWDGQKWLAEAPLWQPEFSVATAAQIPAVMVPPGIEYLRTAGYSTVGDGGAALYERVVSEPTHAAKQQSLDGAWWELAEGEVNPKMLGAVVDGTTPASTQMQQWLDYLAAGDRGGFWPMAAGERYNITSRVYSVQNDLSIIGNIGPTRNQNSLTGYATGPQTGITALFDWGNDQVVLVGAFHMEKVAFYRSGSIADYPAVLASSDGNQPMRGFMLRDVSCKGFKALVEVKAPTGGTVHLGGACNLTLENCNVHTCNYAVLATSRTLNASIVGNQLEWMALGAIHGLLDGNVTITDNMLEGQPNAIRIYNVSRNKTYLARNYFEAQSGDYAVSYETSSHSDNELVVDENYGWFHNSNTCTDLIRLKGGGKLRFLPNAISLASNRQQLFSLQGWFGWMADFNGQGFLAYANVTENKFFSPINRRYSGRSTTGWTVVNNLGSVAQKTPEGDTATARQQTGFAGVYNNVVVTPATGDLVVLCALIKVDLHTTLATAWAPATAYAINAVVSQGGKNWVATSSHTSAAAFETDFLASKWSEQSCAPALYLYNSAFTASLPMVAQIIWPKNASGQWLLAVGTFTSTFTEASMLKLRIGPNSVDSTTNHTLTLASVAVKVVPAAQFDSFQRVSIDHLIPPVLVSNVAHQVASTDADFTATALAGVTELRHSGTLTAARIVTLATTLAYAGQRFHFVRTGGGAFALNIGSPTLKALTTNTWCEVVYDGTAWYLAAFGAL